MNVVSKIDDGAPREWRIVDDLVHLRQWSGATVYRVPSKRDGGVIGSAGDSWIRILEPTSRIKQHARLAWVDGSWVLKALHSTSGVRLDGIPSSVFALSPGAEIEVGGIVLVAESNRLVALRDVLTRLLGWAPEQRVDVDLAMRAVRMSALRREPLHLCGDDADVISAAYLLHQHALGDEHPFIACVPQRGRLLRGCKAAAIIISNPARALAAAAGGTLCIPQGEQFAKIATAMRRSTLPAQVVVCGRRPHPSNSLIRSTIVLPRLRTRAVELDRLIDAYLVDAAADLGGTFLPSDRKWIRSNYANTLAQIEFAARRIVVLRSAHGSITQAARTLGIAHSSLSTWVADRRIPKLNGADG